MTWLSLLLRPDVDPDTAWTLLAHGGVKPLFSNETPDGRCEIVIEPMDPEHVQKHFPFVEAASPYTGDQQTDWTAQWEAHGHQFHDGHVHVDVGNTILKLIPGPGFGDLSHPTTQLTLELMATHVKDRYVLDIGSGSGILTLAAAALGARHAYGVDIDPEAITHARENSRLNGLEQATFSLPEDFIEPKQAGKWVVVINMIWSEQRLAWPLWLDKANHAEAIIVSGILILERNAYLLFVEQWGWRCIEERQSNDWLALVLIPKQQ
jgi:ribosomal protein L11 methyltransferase